MSFVETTSNHKQNDFVQSSKTPDLNQRHPPYKWAKTDSDLSPAPAGPLLQGHRTLLHPNRQIARPLPHHKDEDEVEGNNNDDDCEYC